MNQGPSEVRVSKTRELTCETSRRDPAAPISDKPMPVHHNLAAVVNDIRNSNAISLVTYDGFPTEHRFSSEQFSEDFDALFLDLESIVETEAVFQTGGFFEMIVELGALHPLAVLLAVVEIESNLRKIVLGGTHGLELGMQHFLHPAWKDRNGAVNADDGVERGSLLWHRNILD